jgi:ABC-type dipeptide/oligopeptide/nickel transport systems, permease components
MKFLKFLMSRTITFLLIIFIGVTVVFFIPRFMPSDPVENMLSTIQTNSQTMDADSVEAMRKVLLENFGLQGTLWEQYTGFMKRAIVTQDFGPSLSMYPTPVIQLISQALPWTMGLLLSSTIIAWIIGNLIGMLAGFRKEKKSSKLLEAIAIIVYPTPYYVFALLLIMLFAYLIPIFPLITNVVGTPWTWDYFKSLIYSSMLPALSLIFIDTGWWVLSMKTISMSVAEEDYVFFAKIKGLKKQKIMWNYVMPNALLPQITMLSLRIGTIFGGAMVTEVLFSYPGIGTLIYNSILQSDYNLILGTITVSILAVSIATYIVDLLYPFLDPRVRYQ